MDKTLRHFPKHRQPLPEEYQAIYNEQYRINRNGGSAATSIAQKMEQWLHHQVAADLRSTADARTCATLEIGAGTLNQLPYEPDTAPYDIVEPFSELFDGSPLFKRIRNVYTDITEVPEENRYDRITTIATFEHICDLPQVVARSGLLLNERGTLRVSIPAEGTILWTLGWKLTTGIEFRLKRGLDYGVLMRYEHVNTAREIEEVLRHFFADVHCKVLGVSRGLSFYQFFECRSPIVGRCQSAT
jgi:hypothetical protein